MACKGFVILHNASPFFIPEWLFLFPLYFSLLSLSLFPLTSFFAIYSLLSSNFLSLSICLLCVYLPVDLRQLSVFLSFDLRIHICLSPCFCLTLLLDLVPHPFPLSLSLSLRLLLSSLCKISLFFLSLFPLTSISPFLPLCHQFFSLPPPSLFIFSINLYQRPLSFCPSFYPSISVSSCIFSIFPLALSHAFPLSLRLKHTHRMHPLIVSYTYTSSGKACELCIRFICSYLSER